MPYQSKPLHPLFAAEVVGLDITAPAATLPAKELKGLIDRYGVVVYRNPKPPSDEQHVEFSRLFGPVEVGPMFKIQGDKKRIDNPALVDVGNLDADGNIMKPDNRRMLFRKGDRLWHADMSFHHNRATYSLLLGHEIPPAEAGGDTLFADMRAAYDALPEAMKVMIEDLTVEHSIWHSRQLAGFPEPTQEELDSRPPGLGPQVALSRRARLPHRRLADQSRPRADQEPDELRDPGRVRLSASVETRRPADVGQPVDHAPRDRFRGLQIPPRHAPRDVPRKAGGPQRRGVSGAVTPLPAPATATATGTPPARRARKCPRSQTGSRPCRCSPARYPAPCCS
jgi:hypothetical protein